MRDLRCIGASSTLLREQELEMPDFISLPSILKFVTDCGQLEEFTVEFFHTVRKVKGKNTKINLEALKDMIKDIRCWVKHFYD